MVSAVFKGDFKRKKKGNHLKAYQKISIGTNNKNVIARTKQERINQEESRQALHCL